MSEEKPELPRRDSSAALTRAQDSARVEPMTEEEIAFLRKRLAAVPGYWFSTGHGDIQIETEDRRFLSFPNAEGKNWCEVFRAVHAAAMHTDRIEPYLDFILGATDCMARLLATLAAAEERARRADEVADAMSIALHDAEADSERVRGLLGRVCQALDSDERTRCSGCVQTGDGEGDFDCPGHYMIEEVRREVDAALAKQARP